MWFPVALVFDAGKCDASAVEGVLAAVRAVDAGAVLTRVTPTSQARVVYGVSITSGTLQDHAQSRHTLSCLSRSGISLPFRREYADAGLFVQYPGEGGVFSSGEKVLLTIDVLENAALPLGAVPGAGGAATLGQLLARHDVTLVPLHSPTELHELRTVWLHGKGDAAAAPGGEGEAGSALPLAARLPAAVAHGARTLIAWAQGGQPLDGIRDYFGESIAFYFAFEEVYTRWLLFPAALGVLVWAWGAHGAHLCAVLGLAGAGGQGGSLHVRYTAPFTTALAVSLSLWSSLFLKQWRRTQSELAHGWATLGQAAVESARPQHRGTSTMVNPITGGPETVERAHHHVRRFLTCTVPCMGAVLGGGLAALLLNEQLRHILRKAIDMEGGGAPSMTVTFADNVEDALALLGWSSEARGGSLLLRVLPTRPEQLLPLVRACPPSLRPYLIFLHTAGVQVVTLLLMSAGRGAAEWTTERENHRLKSEAVASLTGKLVLTSCVLTFAPLLYIAFVEQDLALLRQRLMFALVWGALLNGLIETGLPQLKRGIALLTTPGGAQSGGKADAGVTRLRQLYGSVRDTLAFSGGRGGSGHTTSPPSPPTLAGGQATGEASDPPARRDDAAMQRSILAQASLDTYDPYDDVSEMFTQFGYVALFSPVFPLAPLVAWVNNVQEARADAVKLCAMQRPVSVKSAGLGAWNSAFEMMGYASVLVNAGLIGVVTAQADWPVGLSPLARALLVILVEHAVLALKVLLEAQISDVPHNIQTRVLREHVLRPQVVWAALSAVKSVGGVVGAVGGGRQRAHLRVTSLSPVSAALASQLRSASVEAVDPTLGLLAGPAPVLAMERGQAGMEERGAVGRGDEGDCVPAMPAVRPRRSSPRRAPVVQAPPRRGGTGKQE